MTAPPSRGASSPLGRGTTSAARTDYTPIGRFRIGLTGDRLLVGARRESACVVLPVQRACFRPAPPDVPSRCL